MKKVADTMPQLWNALNIPFTKTQISEEVEFCGLRINQKEIFPLEKSVDAFVKCLEILHLSNTLNLKDMEKIRGMNNYYQQATENASVVTLILGEISKDVKTWVDHLYPTLDNNQKRSKQIPNLYWKGWKQCRETVLKAKPKRFQSVNNKYLQVFTDSSDHFAGVKIFSKFATQHKAHKVLPEKIQGKSSTVREAFALFVLLEELEKFDEKGDFHIQLCTDNSPMA